MTYPKTPYFDDYDYFLLLTEYQTLFQNSGIKILATRKVTKMKKTTHNKLQLEEKLLFCFKIPIYSLITILPTRIQDPDLCLLDIFLWGEILSYVFLSGRHIFVMVCDTFINRLRGLLDPCHFSFDAHFISFFNGLLKNVPIMMADLVF